MAKDCGDGKRWSHMHQRCIDKHSKFWEKQDAQRADAENPEGHKSSPKLSSSDKAAIMSKIRRRKKRKK